MKAKQEAGDVKKSSEKAASEAEAKREGLTQERESVMAAFEQTQVTATEVLAAVSQAEAFASEQGENLDPEAKAEIDAIRNEAAEVMQKFEALKADLARIDNELAALGSTEAATKETAAEAQVDFSALDMEQATALLNEKLGPIFEAFTEANTAMESKEQDSQKLDAISTKLDANLRTLEGVQEAFLKKLAQDRPDNAAELNTQINGIRGQIEERSDQLHGRLRKPKILSAEDLQTFFRRRNLTNEIEGQKIKDVQDQEHDELIAVATFLKGRYDRGVKIDPAAIASLEERVNQIPANVYSDLDRLADSIKRIKAGSAT